MIAIDTDSANPTVLAFVHCVLRCHLQRQTATAEVMTRAPSYRYMQDGTMHIIQEESRSAVHTTHKRHRIIALSSHQRKQATTLNSPDTILTQHTCTVLCTHTQLLSFPACTASHKHQGNPIDLCLSEQCRTIIQKAYLAGLRASCASLTLALASSSSLSSAGIADLLASAALRISPCLRSRLEAFSASSLACDHKENQRDHP